MADDHEVAINVPMYYANSVRVHAGVYDFHLDFSFARRDGTLPAATIAMSPHHAKALHILLGRFLAIYEGQFSNIVLPEDLVSKLEGRTTEEPHEPS